MEIKKVKDPQQRALIVSQILEDLPEWFGIEEATRAYVESAKKNDAWAAFVNNEAIGFITLSATSVDCAEIVCMGVAKKFQGQGVGSKLLGVVESCLVGKYSLLQVKTVAQGYYECYDATNRFYRRNDFHQLEIFPDLWDAHNPCQLWVKPLNLSRGVS